MHEGTVELLAAGMFVVWLPAVLADRDLVAQVPQTARFCPTCGRATSASRKRS